MESHIIGLKEFRENTQKYIERIQKGETFTVVRRSAPVFTLAPPQNFSMQELNTLEHSQDIIARYKKDLERLADA